MENFSYFIIMIITKNFPYFKQKNRDIRYVLLYMHIIFLFVKTLKLIHKININGTTSKELYADFALIKTQIILEYHLKSSYLPGKS